MRTPRLIAAVLVFPLLLAAGCATTGAGPVTGPSGLTTCVFAAGDGHPMFEPRLVALMHLQVVPSLAQAAARGCDAAFKVHHPNARSVQATAEVFSVRTGASLAKVSAGGYFLELMAGNLRSAAFTELRAGTPARAALDRDLAAAPTPAPAAPAQSAPAVPAVAAAPAAHPSLAPRYALPERPDDFAVVVGIEDYSEVPSAPYAANDAAAFKAHLLALGVPERNIATLTGSKAGRSALEKYLEQWLPRLVGPKSRVYFYFSGHGAPDVKTGQAYLVPWDGDPNFLETTGYPVARLYKKLEALPAERVLVAIDSCFSGAGGRSVLAPGARPLVVSLEAEPVAGRLTALAASGPNEISGSLDRFRHGAFTYYLLQGLNGAAADASGRVGAKGLIGFLTPKVQDEARRLNRDQTPRLLGDDFPLR